MDNVNKFNSKLGFILTAVGSAVGMANVWGFPYKLQEGGLFYLIFYIFFIALFAYVGLSAEFAIGRRARTGTLGSYEYAFTSRKKSKLVGLIVGILPLIGLILLTIGYAVVISYIFKALFDSVTGTLFSSDLEIWYENLTNTDHSVWVFHVLVIILALINCIGSAKSLEKSSKIMMPAFFILFLIIAITIATLPNSIEGYKYMFRPDFKQINLRMIATAMGQAFFSLSITGSAMMMCGAYLDKKEDIISSSKMTALLDSLAALLASFVMIPSIIVFNMENAQGPGLLFKVLPTILKNIPAGNLISIILYLAVLFAGISSLQIMFEAVVESLTYKIKFLNRIAGLIGLALLVLIIGLNMEKINQWGPF